MYIHSGPWFDLQSQTAAGRPRPPYSIGTLQTFWGYCFRCLHMWVCQSLRHSTITYLRISKLSPTFQTTYVQEAISGISSPMKKKFKECKVTSKMMATVFWDLKGVILSNILRSGARLNCDRNIETRSARLPHVCPTRKVSQLLTSPLHCEAKHKCAHRCHKMDSVTARTVKSWPRSTRFSPLWPLTYSLRGHQEDTAERRARAADEG
jgi:hypothetical protein